MLNQSYSLVLVGWSAYIDFLDFFFWSSLLFFFFFFLVDEVAPVGSQPQQRFRDEEHCSGNFPLQTVGRYAILFIVFPTSTAVQTLYFRLIPKPLIARYSHLRLPGRA